MERPLQGKTGPQPTPVGVLGGVSLADDSRQSRQADRPRPPIAHP